MSACWKSQAQSRRSTSDDMACPKHLEGTITSDVRGQTSSGLQATFAEQSRRVATTPLT
jgi:hypothetical protein